MEEEEEWMAKNRKALSREEGEGSVSVELTVDFSVIAAYCGHARRRGGERRAGEDKAARQDTALAFLWGGCEGGRGDKSNGEETG